MTQLTKESQKAQELENKLLEIEVKSKPQDTRNNGNIVDNLEFGSWVSQTNLGEIDIYNDHQLEFIVAEGNVNYENQLKNSLAYFHSRFKSLYDKMTAIVIQSADDQSKWSIEEEQYKAEIENLKSQLNQKEDDRSVDSPGLLGYPCINVLQRKCLYLEESYKYIRTLNENIKNEYLESQKEKLLLTAEYEIKVQRLIICVSNISDKLRDSINVDLFWKQHEALTDLTMKYRKLLSSAAVKDSDLSEIYKKLASDKMDIMGTLQNQLSQKGKNIFFVSLLLRNFSVSYLTFQ